MLMSSIKLLSMFDDSQQILFQNSKPIFFGFREINKGAKTFSFARGTLYFLIMVGLILRAKKGTPTNGLKHIFLLILIREEIKMSFNYSEAILDLLPSEFDLFISQTPLETHAISSGVANQGSKKEMEAISVVQARQILVRLVEKSKVASLRKNWKVDETNYLLFLVRRYCQVNGVNSQQLSLLDWQRISRLVPNRDSSACEFRFLSLKPSSITHTPWSAEQREILLRIIQKENQGNLNWKVISQKLYEISKEKVFRTGKQCREHYTCFLRPNLKKGPWTDEEDYQLMALFLKLGKKWSKMTKFIDGRNQNSIKNRFFLIFQSKNQIRYSHSDLVKMVRRRMDKISKKISINPSQKCISEENNNNTLTNSDSSNFQTERQNQEGQQFQVGSFRSQIFFNECPEPHSHTAVKIQDSGEMFGNSQQFQRYIDL